MFFKLIVIILTIIIKLNYVLLGSIDEDKMWLMMNSTKNFNNEMNFSEFLVL